MTTKTPDLTEMLKAYRNILDARESLDYFVKYDRPDSDRIEFRKRQVEEAEAEFEKVSEKFNVLCDAGNGKARNCRLTPYEIAWNIVKLENQFHCRKKDLEGLIVHVNAFPQSVSSRYKYAFKTTCFGATFIKGKWRLLYTERADTKNTQRFRLIFSNCDCNTMLENWNFY